MMESPRQNATADVESTQAEPEHGRLENDLLELQLQKMNQSVDANTATGIL